MPFAWITALALALIPAHLSAHCQMPCGIYHDDIVYDQIDQYIETMYKAMAIINDSKFANAFDRNELIRWIMTKDHQSDDTAQLITSYFLQQKIKPDEPDTPKKLALAHQLLFLLVKIKQNTDVNVVKEFEQEWDKFKVFFHRVDYECQMEKNRIKELDELKKKQLGNSKAEETENQPQSFKGNPPQPFRG